MTVRSSKDPGSPSATLTITDEGATRPTVPSRPRNTACRGDIDDVHQRHPHRNFQRHTVAAQRIVVDAIPPDAGSVTQ